VTVETVEDQKTKTVDITKNSSNSFAVGENLDLGEPSVRIYFDYDDDQLRENSLSDLLGMSRIMRDNPSYTLMIEGHADERGSREYNLALSERRANAVKDFLSSSGVSPFNIETVGYGEERPVKLGSNEESWAKNRRAELFLLK
tara:strand:- start:205 stop:636 length:432 start_codon:yes stop_codon:yes gene_type:complete